MAQSAVRFSGRVQLGPHSWSVVKRESLGASELLLRVSLCLCLYVRPSSNLLKQAACTCEPPCFPLWSRHSTTSLFYRICRIFAVLLGCSL